MKDTDPSVGSGSRSTESQRWSEIWKILLERSGEIIRRRSVRLQPTRFISIEFPIPGSLVVARVKVSLPASFLDGAA